MREERLLQILGLTLAVLLIAIGAFAVGVVVGRHGRLAWNPEAALGRGVPGGGTFPRPQVVGRIQQQTAQSLTLTTRRGPRTVALTPETQYRTQDGDPLTLDDLHTGDLVAVWGTFTEPNTLEARTVVRLKEKR